MDYSYIIVLETCSFMYCVRKYERLKSKNLHFKFEKLKED